LQLYADLRPTTSKGIADVLLGSRLKLVDASISHIPEKRIKIAAAQSDGFPCFFLCCVLLLTDLLSVITGTSPRLYLLMRGLQCNPTLLDCNERDERSI
jgi:hypothetical protein